MPWEGLIAWITEKKIPNKKIYRIVASYLYFLIDLIMNSFIPWKERPASFQAMKCAVPDDVRLASVKNHIPNMVLNYGRCCVNVAEREKKRGLATCVQNVMSSFALQHASHLFMANNPH
ncbi:hypothetical protein TNCV_3935701 [Trichonephila clavipes]|nr:hypothetical protein TNCV_3935701 [Trichonephila clavipes]